MSQHCAATARSQPKLRTHLCRQQFKAGKNAEQVAFALADVALKRYTTDNVSVVVIDFKGEGWTAKPPKKARATSSGGGVLGTLFGKKG